MIKFSYKIFSLIVAILIINKSINCNDQPSVNIKFGKITGNSRSIDGVKVNEYVGIPYAEPPVGELRFQKPRPYTKMTDISATKISSVCPQAAFGNFDQVKLNEDCLYLNVWSPS